MTGEPTLTQQQRAAIELYVRSKWIKASLALEDENLFIEYAQPKRDQTTPTNTHDESPPPATTIATGISSANGSTSNNETADTITSQKRTVKIVKPDNTGLGKLDVTRHKYFNSIVFFRHQHQRWTRKSNANFNQ